MKFFFSSLFVCASAFSFSQTICGTTGEGGNLLLTAPPGNVFISVTFASYGTPDGSCGAFTLGGCHASNSQSIVSSYLVGNNSATIPAINGVFGDPCGGTVKRLYVEAIYSSLAPLKLITFSGTVKSAHHLLNWSTTDEINTAYFDVEKSEDGAQFISAGTVMASNRHGVNQYSFAVDLPTAKKNFYRLKMLDLDGKYVYSNIIKIIDEPAAGLQIFPNPATDYITLTGATGNGTIDLLSSDGSLIRRATITSQAYTICIAGEPKGLYFVRYTTQKGTTIRKLMKQ